MTGIEDKAVAIQKIKNKIEDLLSEYWRLCTTDAEKSILENYSNWYYGNNGAKSKLDQIFNLKFK